MTHSPNFPGAGPPNEEPVRRVVMATWRINRRTGLPELVPYSDVATSIVGGELRTVQTLEEFVCGCSREPGVPGGGRCFRCGGLSCVKHHATCAQCRMPVCPEHGLIFLNPDRTGVVLCVRCGDGERRRRLVSGVCRSVLNLFNRRGNSGGHRS